MEFSSIAEKLAATAFAALFYFALKLSGVLRKYFYRRARQAAIFKHHRYQVIIGCHERFTDFIFDYVTPVLMAILIIMVWAGVL